MKTLTAEEILDKYPCLLDKEDAELVAYSHAIEAMNQFATQQSAIAVEKRNEEIKEWMENNESGWYSELLQFLSTPTEPTPATQSSQNLRSIIDLVDQLDKCLTQSVPITCEEHESHITPNYKQGECVICGRKIKLSRKEFIEQIQGNTISDITSEGGYDLSKSKRNDKK